MDEISAEEATQRIKEEVDRRLFLFVDQIELECGLTFVGWKRAQVKDILEHVFNVGFGMAHKMIEFRDMIELDRHLGIILLASEKMQKEDES